VYISVTQGNNVSPPHWKIASKQPIKVDPFMTAVLQWNVAEQWVYIGRYCQAHRHVQAHKQPESSNLCSALHIDVFGVDPLYGHRY